MTREAEEAVTRVEWERGKGSEGMAQPIGTKLGAVHKVRHAILDRF